MPGTNLLTYPSPTLPSAPTPDTSQSSPVPGGSGFLPRVPLPGMLSREAAKDVVRAYLRKAHDERQKRRDAAGAVPLLHSIGAVHGRRFNESMPPQNLTGKVQGVRLVEGDVPPVGLADTPLLNGDNASAGAAADAAAADAAAAAAAAAASVEPDAASDEDAKPWADVPGAGLMGVDSVPDASGSLPGIPDDMRVPLVDLAGEVVDMPFVEGDTPSVDVASKTPDMPSVNGDLPPAVAFASAAAVAERDAGTAATLECIYKMIREGCSGVASDSPHDN